MPLNPRWSQDIPSDWHEAHKDAQEGSFIVSGVIMSLGEELDSEEVSVYSSLQSSLHKLISKGKSP